MLKQAAWRARSHAWLPPTPTTAILHGDQMAPSPGSTPIRRPPPRGDQQPGRRLRVRAVPLSEAVTATLARRTIDLEVCIRCNIPRGGVPARRHHSTTRATTSSADCCNSCGDCFVLAPPVPPTRCQGAPALSSSRSSSALSLFFDEALPERLLPSLRSTIPTSPPRRRADAPAARFRCRCLVGSPTLRRALQRGKPAVTRRRATSGSPPRGAERHPPSSSTSGASRLPVLEGRPSACSRLGRTARGDRTTSGSTCRLRPATAPSARGTTTSRSPSSASPATTRARRLRGRVQLPLRPHAPARRCRSPGPGATPSSPNHPGASPDDDLHRHRRRADDDARDDRAPPATISRARRGRRRSCCSSGRGPHDTLYHGPLTKLPRALIDAEARLLARARAPEYVQDRLRARAADVAQLLADDDTFSTCAATRAMERACSRPLADVLPRHGLVGAAPRRDARAEGSVERLHRFVGRRCRPLILDSLPTRCLCERGRIEFLLLLPARQTSRVGPPSRRRGGKRAILEFPPETLRALRRGERRIVLASRARRLGRTVGTGATAAEGGPTQARRSELDATNGDGSDFRLPAEARYASADSMICTGSSGASGPEASPRRFAPQAPR